MDKDSKRGRRLDNNSKRGKWDEIRTKSVICDGDGERVGPPRPVGRLGTAIIGSSSPNDGALAVAVADHGMVGLVSQGKDVRRGRGLGDVMVLELHLVAAKIGGYG